MSRTLPEWLDYLDSLHFKNIDMGLERVLQVYRRMGKLFPHSKVITVAGTNGKGTTIGTLEALILSKGLTVGAYTSPHIDTFNERVRVNGIDVDDASLVEAFENIEAFRRNVSLTYFEFTTLVALQVFSKLDCLDFILLEVGLGGRLDAVNVVDSDVAIITSIAIDHTDWLGDDRESIGFEKAGVLRLNGKAVYGELDIPSSVKQQVNAQGVELRQYGVDFWFDANESKVVSQNTSDNTYQEYFCQETDVPLSNQLCAVEALRMLGVTFESSQLNDLLSGVNVPGRMEVISRSPMIIVDVAHNPHAAHHLTARLRQYKAKFDKVICLFSMLEDKEISGVISELCPVVDQWIVFPLNVERAASLELMGKCFEEKNTNVLSYPSPEEAMASVINNEYQRNGEVLTIVCGSFYTVSTIKKYWNK